MISGSAGDTHCGVGDYAYELAQHLALDAQVDLYYDRRHAPAQLPYEKLSSLQLLPLSGFSVLSVTQLSAKLRGEGYDIIHLQYPSKGYGSSVGPGFLPQNLAGMRSRSRLVLTLHEWTTSHPLRRMVMDQMLPSIDALIVSSESEMQALQKKMGDRLVVVLPVGNVLRSSAELESVWLRAAGEPVPSLPAPQPPFVGATDRSPTLQHTTGDLSVAPTQRIPYSIFHYGLPAKGKGLEIVLGALQEVRKTGLQAVLHLGGDFPPGEQHTAELLAQITDLGLTECVERLGHMSATQLEEEAQSCWLGVFPFEEGFSSKRSSIASISHLDLPLAVGAGSEETHPYYAPEQNSAAALAVLLLDLMSSPNCRLISEWDTQVTRQREFAERFSFGRLAANHLDIYERLRKVDV